jgi:hypothetical protein
MFSCCFSYAIVRVGKAARRHHMIYRVDSWKGYLHQAHKERREFNCPEKALEYVKSEVDSGYLCNVLRTDYVIPEN